MLLSLSILGIILSIILVSFNIRKFSSSFYLGGFFFLVSLYAFIEYVVLYSKSVFLVGLVFINFGFPTYLIGPMVYWYVRSVLTDKSRLFKRDLWHFVPMLLVLFGSLHYMTTSWAYKKVIATSIIQNFEQVKSISNLFVFNIFSKAFAYWFRPVQIIVYTLLCIVLLLRYKRQMKNEQFVAGQHFMLNWLTLLLGFLFILNSSHTIQIFASFTLKNLLLFNSMNSLLVISALGLAGLLISPFFFPSILYGMPRWSQPQSTPPNNNPVKPGFESDYLKQLGKSIETCMREKQFFLNKDCNLASFSKVLNIPAHHLAYYFKEVKKQTFNDYRNELRIKHAKQLLREGKAKELTLEGIGQLSGFSSRITFFNAFKKYESVSPGAFLAQLEIEY